MDQVFVVLELKKTFTQWEEEEEDSA